MHDDLWRCPVLTRAEERQRARRRVAGRTTRRETGKGEGHNWASLARIRARLRAARDAFGTDTGAITPPI